MNKPTFLSDQELIAASTDVFVNINPTPYGSVSPPIFQTSLFTFESYDEIARVFSGDSQSYIYSRGNNPTVHELETLVARLEGAEAGRGFTSGTAAIASSVMPFVEAGDRIVAVENLYVDAYCLFEKVLASMGCMSITLTGLIPRQ